MIITWECDCGHLNKIQSDKGNIHNGINFADVCESCKKDKYVTIRIDQENRK